MTDQATDPMETNEKAGNTTEAGQIAGGDHLLASIGSRLRKIRKARGITLDALARKTGFTKSYLSKIENSLKVPPIASLIRISKALDVDISALFDSSDMVAAPVGANEPKVSLVRFHERRPAVSGGSSFGYDYQSLVRGTFKRQMEPFVATFPNYMSEDVRFEHQGEELIFVLSGRVRFIVNDDVYVLQSGDSLFFDAALPHRGESIGDTAKALIIIVNPSTADSPDDGGGRS